MIKPFPKRMGEAYALVLACHYSDFIKPQYPQGAGFLPLAIHHRTQSFYVMLSVVEASTLRPFECVACPWYYAQGDNSVGNTIKPLL